MATIRHLAEQALTAYLDGAGLGVTVAAGTASDDKEAPLVICTATEWEEDEHDLNWFRVKATIEVKAPASDGAAAFDTLCTAVRDAIRILDLGDELAAAQDGIVFADGGTSDKDRGTFAVAEDIWVETRELELYCALS